MIYGTCIFICKLTNNADRFKNFHSNLLLATRTAEYIYNDELAIVVNCISLQ